MLHGSQRVAGLIALAFFWSSAASTPAADIASSAHFTVLAPNQRLADMVVQRAESLQLRFSAAWLGRTLPATRTTIATATTTIYVEIDDERSMASTLVHSSKGAHLMWLVGSEAAVTGHALEHELAHVVLASHFGDSMPIWANEGIASRYDNDRRKAIRQQKLAGFVALDSWPHLDRLLVSEIRQQWQYAAAESLTEYLVARGGQAKFIEFVADSIENVDTALATHYGIRSVEQLEHQWRQAVRQQIAQQQRRVELATAREASPRYVR